MVILEDMGTVLFCTTGMLWGSGLVMIGTGYETWEVGREGKG
jgi:hypothetical protein